MVGIVCVLKCKTTTNQVLLFSKVIPSHVVSFKYGIIMFLCVKQGNVAVGKHIEIANHFYY